MLANSASGKNKTLPENRLLEDEMITHLQYSFPCFPMKRILWVTVQRSQRVRHDRAQHRK